MRVLLISDIHGNSWALRAVLQDAGSVDRVLCGGDLVNYGPDPAGVIAIMQNLEPTTVRGNHDNAVVFSTDPRASAAKEPIALAMRDWTRDQLSPADVAWLVSLPRHTELSLGDTRVAMFHATPIDPLYDYRLTPDVAESLLEGITAGIAADVLLLGHTHLPLSRLHRGLRIVNPGSVGQPLDGDPRAAYAIWNDGEIELRRVDYDRSDLFSHMRDLPLAREQIGHLLYTLEHGQNS